MRIRLIKTVALLAFAAYSTLALAQDDPPARVGRISLSQGQVSISGAVGEPAQATLLNWPVATGDLVTTARGARTELRIGSTSVRLDGDSALDVTELTDDTLRLRLHYGSASIRILNAEVLAGFELTTPQGRVRMQEPGRLRVDAERVPDTSVVSVLEGSAQVEGGGASLRVAAGRSAQLSDQDVHTAQAAQDAFDDWALARDRAYTATTATRYVAPEMTGYEELDRYGSWSIDSEYGALWTPVVSSSWVPYRDGRWVWIEPWGWTWVDNAPWGYAPFHYGRWVWLPRHKHWAWAPGQRHQRPAWAPALVGWVGGPGWIVTFDQNRRHLRAPAHGWYPLSPRDRYVPNYRASEDHVRRLNERVRDDNRRPDQRREGLTVVPQDRFGQRGQVQVPGMPLAAVPAPQQGVIAAPPAPPPGVRHRDWRRDDRRDDRRAEDRRWQGRPGRGQVLAPAPVLSTNPAPPPRQPVTAITPAPAMPGQPPSPVRPPVTAVTPPPQLPGQPPQAQPVMPDIPPPRQPVSVLSAPPVLPGQASEAVVPAPQPRWHGGRREDDDDRRGRRDRWIRTQDAAAGQAIQVPAQPAAPAAPATPPAPAAQAAPAPAQPRIDRPDFGRGHFELRREAREAPPQAVAPPMPAPQPMPAAPMPVARPMPAPTPLPEPVARAMAAPPPPPAAPAEAASAPRAHRGGRDPHGLRQQER